jgi:nucleoside-diphosphate-sugar epimerase
MAPKKTVLVTGASGFFGKHLIKSLCKTVDGTIVRMGFCNSSATDITADLTTKGQWQQVIAELSISHVIHLAGVSRTTDRKLLRKIHIDGLSNLLEAVEDANPWFLLVSSGAVYGNVPWQDLPINEKSATAPLTEYALTKVAQEELLRGASDTLKGLCIVRPSNLIGPGLSEGFFLGRVLKQIHDLSSSENLPRILNTGSLDASRDFIDARDASSAISLLTRHGKTGLFNLSTGQEIRLEDAVQLCMPNHVPAITIKQDKGADQNPIKRQILDNTKLMKAVKWSPKYTFRQSVDDMRITLAS